MPILINMDFVLELCWTSSCCWW